MGKSINSTILPQVVDFWWKNLPLSVRPVSRSLAAVVADGYYLAGWPLAGAGLPPLAGILGLLQGWQHPFGGDSYTTSLSAMALMVVISQIGTALGLWLWLGYTFGDFIIYASGVRFGRFSTGLFDPIEDLVRVRLPFLLSDLLLGILLILIPFVSQRLTHETISHLRVPRALRLTAILNIHAGILAGLVYFWTQSVPTLSRPLYTWRQVLIPDGANIPLHQTGWQLVIVAVGIWVVRFLLEFLTFTHSKSAKRIDSLRSALMKAQPGPTRALPVKSVVLTNIILVPIKAVLMTFLLSGLIESWLQGIVAFVGLTFTLLLRDVIIPFVGIWTRLVSRVPLVVRFATGIFIAWFFGSLILNVTWGHDNTFWPMMLSTMMSLFAFVLLLPASAPQPQQTQMSARAFHRILKLARTIADLAGSDKVETPHLAEAIQYWPRKQI